MIPLVARPTMATSYGAENRLLRDRQASIESSFDRSRQRPAGGAARLLVQVYNGGSMPTSNDHYFACHPVDMGGMETEGGAGQPYVDTTRTVFVDVIGSQVPTVGDFLTAYAVGGRWVAERGSNANSGVCQWFCNATCTFPFSVNGRAKGYPVVSSGGKVTAITVTYPGGPNAYPTLYVPVTISAPPPGGTQATATGTVGGITSTTITNVGHGYTTATVTFAAPAIGGILATGTAVIRGGIITAITISNPGGLYAVVNPTVTITGDGAGATATATAGVGQVTSTTVTNPGSGYVNPSPTPAAFNLTMTGNGVTYGPFRLPYAGPSTGNLNTPYGGSPCSWSGSASVTVQAKGSCPRLDNVGVSMEVGGSSGGYFLGVSFGVSQGLLSTVLRNGHYEALCIAPSINANCGEPAPPLFEDGETCCLQTGTGDTYPWPSFGLTTCQSRPYSFTIALTALVDNTTARTLYFFLFGGACSGTLPAPFDVTFTLTEAMS